MAVKTITIDLAAYCLLAGQKQQGESFSQVIKRRLKPASTAADLLANLDRVALRPKTLDHLEKIVRQRSGSPAISPRLD